MKNMLITSIILFLFMFGCSWYENSSTETNESYSSTSPLSTPTVAFAPSPTIGVPTIQLPQPSVGNGAVYGTLIDENGEPITNTIVRLGKVVWLHGQENEEGLVMSDRYRSPQDVTDEWGRYVINEIPPDNYGIVVNDPAGGENTFFISEINQDRLKVVTIEAGMIIDLKKIMLKIDASD